MSYEIWNSNEVKPPLSATFKAKAPDIDVTNVVSLLCDGIETHSRSVILRLESCIMRKVIYRLKLQFRHDKGFKFFEATNRALNKFLCFDITKDMRYFIDYFPRKYEKTVNLPSKQMLEYLLVRLQGYAQICARIVDTSFNCTNYMKTRLILGHQWEIAVVVIAIASRICFICRHLSLKCCLLYNNLLPLLDQLEITGQKWLPHPYEFPKDLTTWLSYDWLIEKPDVILELPVGLPKYSLIDDDDVEFTGQYRLNNTIIIPDDSDEEGDTPDVKFICNLSNKKIRLNKKQAKYLQSRLVINVDDSDSDSDDDGIVPSSNFDDILELLDDDVQIIGSPKNIESDDIVEINDTFERQDKNDDFIEYDSDIEQVDEPEIEIIEDDQDEDEDIGEPVKKIEENENFEENIENNVSDEVNEDIGEPITRKNVAEESNDDEEEISDIEDVLDDMEYLLAECNEEENQIEEENQLQEENIEEKRRLLLAELEEVEKPIKINREFYKFDTIEKIETLLDNENFLRKTGKSRRCLFIDVYDPYWYRIAFYIKYFIAMTIDNIQNRNKFIIKAKNLLAEVARDVNEPITNIQILQDDAKDTAEPMTLKGIEYLINSIDSLSDIQVLLTKEVSVRNKNRRRSSKFNFLFSHINSNEFKEISLKIKCYVVIGIQKPIKSNILLNKSKKCLRKLLLKENYCTDSDSSDGSDIEEVQQDLNIDHIYSSVTKNDVFLDLYNYIQRIEEHIHPPSMSRQLKIKMRQNTRKLHLDGLVVGEYDEAPPNKKRKIITPQTPPKFLKNNNSSPNGNSLTKSQEKKKLQKKENEADTLPKSAEERENENLQLDIVQNNNLETEFKPITENPKTSLTTAKTEALFNTVLFSESYYIPTLDRKERARERRHELFMKKLAEKNRPPTPPPFQLISAGDNYIYVSNKERTTLEKTSALSKNENIQHWRNPVTYPHIISKEELAEIRQEEEKRKKREEYLTEQRSKLDDLWKIEEDEISRLETAEHEYEITTEEREKRMKWLEEEIDKIYEPWTFDEEDIQEIEQTIEQRRLSPARFLPQLLQNIDNPAPPRVEINTRNCTNLSKKQRKRLKQEEELERERREFDRRKAQQAERVRVLKLEQVESTTTTTIQTIEVKIEPTSEEFELAPPLVTIKKEDPDQKPIIRPNLSRQSTSKNKMKEKKLTPREMNQLRQNSMERERIMRIQREEEYARRIYEEEEYRRVYEESVYEEQYRRAYEERTRLQYASVPYSGPYNLNYRGPYESYGRAYEGHCRRPPENPYDAYY